MIVVKYKSYCVFLVLKKEFLWFENEIRIDCKEKSLNFFVDWLCDFGKFSFSCFIF